MDFDSQQERLLEDIVKLAAARKRAFKPVTVLIDGPSGAGKTWTSAALAERTNWRVVHLDEFYPGWHGLEKGSDMVGEQVLRTMNPGYWRWDWEAGAPGDWASLDVRDDLIVEGVGSEMCIRDSLATNRGLKRGKNRKRTTLPPRPPRRTWSGNGPSRRKSPIAFCIKRGRFATLNVSSLCVP